jgi:hypothetical protein
MHGWPRWLYGPMLSEFWNHKFESKVINIYGFKVLVIPRFEWIYEMKGNMLYEN